MAREIKGFTPIRPQRWAKKEEPYECVVDILCEDKSESEAAQAVKEFEESHTYLLICEYGRATPFQIDKIYEAEQKEGLKGFVKAIKKYMPSLFRDE